MLPGLPSLLSLAVLWLSSTAPLGLSEPSIKCFSETGPSKEWMVRNRLTPGGLQTLRVNPVASPSNSHTVRLNISWTLKQDGSIQMLKATKICVNGGGQFLSYGCVRCNYTEAFYNQTPPSGSKWEFHYVGFPIQPETTYFIRAHNIPPANMNEDSTAISVEFTSSGCKNPVMKYTRKCQEDENQWTANITACQEENVVQVNFSTSSFGLKYNVLVLKEGEVLNNTETKELNQSWVSVVIPVPVEEGKGDTVQIIPHFSTCSYVCPRRSATIFSCPEILRPVEPNKSQPWKYQLFIILPSLGVALWVLAVGLYLLWRHERVKKILFHTPVLLPPIKVLIIYHPHVCFYHAVCDFAEYLQDHCRSDVILDQWQKRKIAEVGLVLWVTTQKKEADKIIFFFSSQACTCDSFCYPNAGGHRDSSQDLFTLAFNLFCSDLKSQVSLHKYLVVSLGKVTLAEDHSALGVCPKYQLMKDAMLFCKDLLTI